MFVRVYIQSEQIIDAEQIMETEGLSILVLPDLSRFLGLLWILLEIKARTLGAPTVWKFDRTI